MDKMVSLDMGKQEFQSANADNSRPLKIINK
jgi:hypothetical protein